MSHKVFRLRVQHAGDTVIIRTEGRSARGSVFAIAKESLDVAGLARAEKEKLLTLKIEEMLNRPVRA